MKIGIFGGTFNPIHNGHLILSEFIREEAKLDKIILIPTGIPPHKNKDDILDSLKREQMLQLAIGANPNYSISSIESQREDTSYTIDTIKELKTIFHKDDLYMLMGGDSLLELHTWKEYKKIISSIKIIVMDRYSSTNDLLIRKINKYNKDYKGQVKSIKSPIIEISSSQIRQRIQTGLSIKYMVPKAVEEYIINNKLYK